MKGRTATKTEGVSDRAGAKEAPVYSVLQREVIDAGLCTHCGTCAGLSSGQLEMRDGPRGPLPRPAGQLVADLPYDALAACPGRGIDYPELSEAVFGRQPDNWLLGCYRTLFTGFSAEPEVRRAGASGGVLTQVQLHLLETGAVDGVVTVRLGGSRPWEGEAVIATTRQEVLECSQSVYAPVPVNALLPEMERFQGTLAYVGLPDHIASLRRLQQQGHPGASKVRMTLGLYFGMGMYFGAIESFLRSKGVKHAADITELRYREGEWPGYLQIKMRSGAVYKAEKFYYNYLLPFYATRATLLSVDLTNELADISVGDAWHPRFERQGKGFSVVVARSQQGEDTLREMRDSGLLSLEETSVEDALAMHGHMLDFKKRGAFIRMDWRRLAGKPVPDYGYRPAHIPISRRLAEVVISGIFVVCGTALARAMMERVPLAILGPTFSVLRRSWKRLSKPTKRAGLHGIEVVIETRDSVLDSRSSRSRGR